MTKRQIYNRLLAQDVELVLHNGLRKRGVLVGVDKEEIVLNPRIPGRKCYEYDEVLDILPIEENKEVDQSA